MSDDPRRVYGICRQVLQAVGDDRAATILLRARTHLAEQADRLTNARQRMRFIQQGEEALGNLPLPVGRVPYEYL
jgi:hypothetical protein